MENGTVRENDTSDIFSKLGKGNMSDEQERKKNRCIMEVSNDF